MPSHAHSISCSPTIHPALPCRAVLCHALHTQTPNPDSQTQTLNPNTPPPTPRQQAIHLSGGRRLHRAPAADSQPALATAVSCYSHAAAAPSCAAPGCQEAAGGWGGAGTETPHPASATVTAIIVQAVQPGIRYPPPIHTSTPPPPIQQQQLHPTLHHNHYNSSNLSSSTSLHLMQCSWAYPLTTLPCPALPCPALPCPPRRPPQLAAPQRPACPRWLRVPRRLLLVPVRGAGRGHGCGH